MHLHIKWSTCIVNFDSVNNETSNAIDHGINYRSAYKYKELTIIYINISAHIHSYLQ